MTQATPAIELRTSLRGSAARRRRERLVQAILLAGGLASIGISALIVVTLIADALRFLAAVDLSALNTIGYVFSRYGCLTGVDLERLTHNEPPWQMADARRQPRESTPIERAWIRDYFRTEGAPEDTDDPPLDSAVVAEWLRDARDRQQEPSRVDSLEELAAWATRVE